MAIVVFEKALWQEENLFVTIKIIKEDQRHEME